MKTFRAKIGPFKEQTYYKESDIENICSDELRATNLFPSTPGPVRIDRFIEKRFNVVHSYEDLGEGILGLTKFGPSGVKAIMIARSLEEDASLAAKRRVRTTLAHEGGHGLFHTHLFAMSAEKRPMFGDFTDPNAPKILCRDEGEAKSGYRGQWWEYQANMAIGGLLMPKLLVETAVETFLVESGSLGLKSFDHSRTDEATRLLVATFDVNPVVAKIRLGQLFPVSESAQLSL
jgi:hypothetical protein